MLSNVVSKEIYTEAFPREVRIETINTCNQTCSFCPMSVYSEESKTRKVEKMDEALFKKIIDELASLNYNNILKLYTQNEPLLDSRLPSFVRYIKEKLPDLAWIQIDTNGKLLTEKLGIELITAGITYLHVNDYTKTGGGGLNNKKEPIKSVYDKLRKRFPDIQMIYWARQVEEVLDSRAGHAPNNPLVLSKSIQASCV